MLPWVVCVPPLGSDHGGVDGIGLGGGGGGGRCRGVQRDRDLMKSQAPGQL